MSSVDEAPIGEIPGDTLRAGLLDEFRAELGDALVDSHLKPGDDLWLRIRTDAWREAGRAARRLGFEHFCFLSGIDWLPSPFGRGEDDPTQPQPERDDTVRQGYAGGETRLQVFARVTNLRRHVGVTLKADVPESLALDSWVPVYAGANWHERETWEMFGVTFAGHPDLRHIYLPTEYEGFPLRKDYPLLSRMVKPWPGIVDVEPLPGVDEDDEEASS